MHAVCDRNGPFLEAEPTPHGLHSGVTLDFPVFGFEVRRGPHAVRHQSQMSVPHRGAGASLYDRMDTAKASRKTSVYLSVPHAERRARHPAVDAGFAQATDWPGAIGLPRQAGGRQGAISCAERGLDVSYETVRRWVGAKTIAALHAATIDAILDMSEGRAPGLRQPRTCAKRSVG
jgi:hypothetical protein